MAGLAIGLRGNGHPVSDEVAFGGTPAGVTAAAHLEARPWGTSIDLRVAGLPAGSVNSVWLEDATGRRTPAGTFTGVAGRTLAVRLAAATSRAASVAIGVSDANGTTLLRAPLQ